MQLFFKEDSAYMKETFSRLVLSLLQLAETITVVFNGQSQLESFFGVTENAISMLISIAVGCKIGIDEESTMPESFFFPIYNTRSFGFPFG